MKRPEKIAGHYPECGALSGHRCGCIWIAMAYTEIEYEEEKEKQKNKDTDSDSQGDCYTLG